MSDDGDDPVNGQDTASRDASGSYAVGYGKPPVHTRFAPGRSGNPKGKAKGRQGLKEVVEAALHEKISVRTPRGVRRISKIEALVQKLMNDALKGDAKAVPQVVKLAKDAGLIEIAATIESAIDEVAAEDLQILERYLGSDQEQDDGGNG